MGVKYMNKQLFWLTGFKGLFECNKKVRKNSAFDIFVKGILNFIHIFLVYSYIPIN